MNITTEEIIVTLKIIRSVTTDSSVWVELFPDKSGRFCIFDNGGHDKTLFSFGAGFSQFYKHLGEFLAE